MSPNRTTFFANARRDPFGGSMSQLQADGCNAILDEWDARNLTDIRWLAYILGTTFHETGKTMEPVTEVGPRAYFDKYEVGTRIGAALGNTVKGDGYKYRGRGYVQITGRTNYSRAGIVDTPEAALKPAIAAAIIFDGMIGGWFTGKKLADYFHESTADWINARRIVNGTDKAATIAGYGKAFYAALIAAAIPGPAPSPAPQPPVQPLPPVPGPIPPLRPQPAPAPLPAPSNAGKTASIIVIILAVIAGVWSWLSHIFGGG